VIYSVTITAEGMRTMSHYDGSNDVLPFFHAVILIRLFNESEAVALADLVTAVDEDYPISMDASAISEACLTLERRGFLCCIREVTMNTRIVVKVQQMRVLTRLGEFFRVNRLNKVQCEKAIKDLQNRASHAVKIGSLEVELKLV
jgi:hypothetical protein